MLDRGLEADECYYIEHYPDVKGRKEVNLDTDPPPDLAVEVDLSSSSIDKLSIYAGLAVPEVWRFHHDRFDCLHLQPDGTYAPDDQSRVFPALPLYLILNALEERAKGEFEAVSEFRDAVVRLLGRP